MNVSFDCGDEEFAGGGTGGALFFGLHEGLQIGHSFFHDAGALDDLRKKHLTVTEEVADGLHAVHQRAFNHFERARVRDAGLLGIFLDMRDDSFDQGVGEPFLDGAGPPVSRYISRFFFRAERDCIRAFSEEFFENFRILLLSGPFEEGTECFHAFDHGGIDPLFGSICAECGGAVFDGFGLFDESLGRVGSSVEKDILNKNFERRVDLGVVHEETGIDDSHVHSRCDGVVEEGCMHGLAHRVVAPKREGDIRESAAGAGTGAALFDFAHGFDEVDGVVVVFLHAGGDSEDVEVENDVLRIEADFVGEDFVGAFGDGYLVSLCGGLPGLVEGHDDDSGSVAADGAGLLAKFVFAAF